MSNAGRSELVDAIRGAKISLVQLHPVEFSARRTALAPTAPLVDIDLAVRAHNTVTRTPDGLSVLVDMHIAASEASEAPVPYFECTYKFFARYVVADKPLEEALHERFVNDVVMMQVWPYARIFVQEATQRLAVPQVILPFYFRDATPDVVAGESAPFPERAGSGAAAPDTEPS